METTSATIRPARPGESEALSGLTVRSKAHWGYDDSFMEACREELRVTEDAIASGGVAVLETDGRVVGVYSLRSTLAGRAAGESSLRSTLAGRAAGVSAELEHFFVEPDRIGHGYGRRLWEHAVETARDAGARRLVIQSDPNAEGFYLRMGAERVGDSPSDSIAGRVLPLLELRL